MRVLDPPLANVLIQTLERCDAAEDLSADIVEDNKVEANIVLELRHDARRVHVVQRGEVANDAPLVRSTAPAENRGELAVDAVRTAIRLDRESARLARGYQVPLAN